MKEIPDARHVVQQNAKRIRELHQRIHETFARRDKDAEARSEWETACAEFHTQYDTLAFPGGYETGLEKVRMGERNAIENALAFLEVRPYFFRSQYMRTKFIRLLKHVNLTAQQSYRFQEMLKQEYQRKKKVY